MLQTVTTKQCSTCKTILPLSDFYRSIKEKDGYRWQCKTCSRTAQITWYRDKGGKEWQKKRKQSLIGRAETRRHVRRYRMRHPDKRRAHSKVHAAVVIGKLLPVRTLLCIHCLSPATQYHHTHGYSNAHTLDVVPVCDDCHRFIHSLPLGP